jgi:hypothetical protein
MSRTASSPRWIPAALACLAVAACTPAQQPTRSEEAQYDACRRHADVVTTRQNRDILSQDDPISSPYGEGSTLQGTMDTLSVEHQQQDLLADCLNHLDTQPANTGVVSAHPAAAVTAEPIPVAPADLAGPSSNDLARPPVLGAPNP